MIEETALNLSGKGLPPYSELGFGESLSKVARHQLTLLCLRGIEQEYRNKPIPNKSRGCGRPTSPMGILAKLMGVSPDSVRRWMDLKEVQASDHNSEKLAEMAYRYSPEGVAQILKDDIEQYKTTMEAWLKKAEAKYSASPHVKNLPNDRGNALACVDQPNWEGDK